MAHLALSPVSVALFTLLNVATITDQATGGVVTDIPQAPTFPLVWLEVLEPRDMRGFGTGGFPEIEIRVHVFSAAETLTEAQTIARLCISLLRDATLTVTGYTQAGRVFYDGTTPLPNEQILGVKVHELVSMFRTYVEEP